MSLAEECLAVALESNPLPGWDLERQYAFHPTRRWTFDFAFPSVRLAVEVEGARHRTYKGHRDDCEKMNAAVAMGWRILRFPSDLSRLAPEWADQVREVLCSVCSPSPPSTSNE